MEVEGQHTQDEYPIVNGENQSVVTITGAGGADQELEDEDQSNEFYLKYYSGHEGQFGHEFLQFEVKLAKDGNSATVNYTNNTNYRREARIEKSFTVSAMVASQFKKLVDDSEIVRETDNKWPPRDREGKQELIIRNGSNHAKFVTTKIGSLTDVKKSEDPDGLRVFYFFVQDVKALIFSLINLHFKVKPI